MQNSWKTVGIVIGFLIGGFFVYLSVSAMDWQVVSSTLAAVEPVWALLCLPLLGLAFYIRLYRWQRMLIPLGSKASLSDLAPPFLGSFALNNVLPLRIGDGVRAAGFQNSIGVSASGGLASLIVERVYDLYALLLVGLVALVGVDFVNTMSEPASLQGAIIGLATVITILSALLLFPRSFVRLALVIKRTALGKIIPGILWRFGIRTMLRVAQISEKSNRLVLMGLSTGAWMVEGSIVYFAAKALTVLINLTDGWLALIAANLGTLIPGTPGHFGTFHFIGGHTLAVSQAGLSESLLVITLAHFIIWSGITVVGFVALALQRRGGMILASLATEKSTKA